jgi:phytoene dehydrogenase-like protein
MMDYDVIIVGGGAAGLTAAAYCARAGFSTALFEKQKTLGGLVQSVANDGFTFDMGLRAIENSGIIFPMLDELGISLDTVRSTVSVGVKDQMITIDSPESLRAYQDMLTQFYPESSRDIEHIMQLIRKVMKHMEVLYGIDNPLFKDLKHDISYLFSTVLPWLPRFLTTIGKINRMHMPVEELLDTLTDNQSLKNIIGQHFFKKTPAFFAMSYFSVYMDYQYPLGGTGSITQVLAQYINDHQVDITCNSTISTIDPVHQTVTDNTGALHSYQSLIWCCDIHQLYDNMDLSMITDNKLVRAITDRKHLHKKNRGSDSVFSLFVSVDENPQYFADIATGHCFYTPVSEGLGDTHTTQYQELLSQYETTATLPDSVKKYLDQYFSLTTYEISIPVLKDPTMAPPGKTGLIVSCLLDYELFEMSVRDGWYEDLKTYCSESMIGVLSGTLYPDFSKKIIRYFNSTPVTIERTSGNTQGAITGWSFDTDELPAIHEMQQVARSVRTPIKHILQAGQWAFSPAGLPMAILTGKLAAERTKKILKYKKRTKT